MIELSLGLSKPNGETMDAKRVITETLQVCAQDFGGGSIVEQHGAYTYDDGSVCFEHSLLIRLYTDDRSLAEKLAKHLCKRYEQESVAITEYATNVRFVG